MSYTDHQNLKYAHGHLFRCHTAKPLETYRVYQNADPMVHEFTLFVYSFSNAARFVLNLILTATHTGWKEDQLQVELRKLRLLRAWFSLRALISYNFPCGRLSNRRITIVLTVYANLLVILCKSGNAVLIALISPTIPGNGILIYSFNILAFYNQHFLVFWKK